MNQGACRLGEPSLKDGRRFPTSTAGRAEHRLQLEPQKPWGGEVTGDH